MNGPMLNQGPIGLATPRGASAGSAGLLDEIQRRLDDVHAQLRQAIVELHEQAVRTFGAPPLQSGPVGQQQIKPGGGAQAYEIRERLDHLAIDIGELRQEIGALKSAL